MATYLELKSQAEKLLAQAEELRQQEIQKAIADIKSKMQAYGITASDLGIAGAKRARAPRAGKPSANRSTSERPVKYRGPNGQGWAGGRGRKPRWLTEALATGKKLEDFEAR